MVSSSLPGGAGRKNMTDEQMTELRQHFETIDQRFDAMDQRFNSVDKRLDAMDQRFDGVDKRFDDVDKRFDDVDRRFDDVDKRFDYVDKRFGEVDKRLSDLDGEVHRRGIQLESNANELKLAIENFQGLQRITNAKIDELGERFDQRIAPLEAAVRTHSAQLAEHARRLDERGQ